jgi:hypothetical protein
MMSRSLGGTRALYSHIFLAVASRSCPGFPFALTGVVDGHLRVYDTANVRVVDASIMPLQISAHLQSTVYAIAEKAADLIKADQ